MRRVCLTLVLFLFASAAPLAAQVSNGELERYYWPGAYVPYGGAGYQTRYSYYPAMIEVGCGYCRDFRRYETMDQIDRQERAWARANSNLLPCERMGPLFGSRCAATPMPTDPRFGPPEILPPPPLPAAPQPADVPPPPPLLPALEQISIHACFSIDG